MKYDIQSIVGKIESGVKMSFVFFWGHDKPKTGIDSSCFSQWYPASFTEDGVTYATAEQYMMAQKARLFKDEETLAEILSAKKPSLCKRLGRQVRHFQPDVWDRSKYGIVLNASLLKFGQNHDCRDFLLNTRDAVLVEASPYDCIWGIGLSKDDARIQNPRLWRGKNLLGFALMETRDILRNKVDTYGGDK